VIFVPDEAMFGNYHYIAEYVESMMKNYSYLNAGMIINLNGNKIVSRNGLVDLLNDNMNREGLYPIIHLKGDDIEMATDPRDAVRRGLLQLRQRPAYITGRNTPHCLPRSDNQDGQGVLQEGLRSVSDIRSSIIAAVSVKIEEPIFESQTKTKLGSKDMGPNGPSVRNYVVDFIRKHLDDYLHKNGETARIMLKKIQESEKERKAISSIQKLARERAKKVSLHNRKLRDCRIHYNSNDERKLESTLFITEGDSASGSITKSRNVETQAVFSLRGKPLNSYGLTKKIVYENEEFNLLQAALNIEESLDDLRYNYVVIATDADVDGMHIRLLLLTFFLQFFPDLVRKGHVYILQTPLFRVRNKKLTRYCYSPMRRGKKQ
jgi:topoisomerase IV subunit B